MKTEIPTPGSLLAAINSPSDLRKLPPGQLQPLCAELRTFIIENVSVFGGHLGAGLGVVELTVALHVAYNTPEDLLVWDVGHQAYAHKILTGRRDMFHTNRQFGGISGFPKRSESEYDTFGVGHSSTSISAALGMAVANKFNKNRKKVTAVIGDGALTAGLAYEGLNNAGASGCDVLIILNDNNISIDSNVGALKEHLAALADINEPHTIRRRIQEAIEFQQLGETGEPDSKQSAGAGSIFEALGFRYFGVADGHDVHGLIEILRDLQKLSGPKILHIKTTKGKGFSPAEFEQTKWHSSGGAFDKITGLYPEQEEAGKKVLRYQDVFGETLAELATDNPRLVAVTPAMLSGSNLIPMQQKFPQRVFDVGIAEQHAVTFSAGLATQGMKVFCVIYSTFLQRGFDQLIHDVAIQNLPVVFCIDRAGFVGQDGPTHHGLYDIAYLRAIPNMVLSAPLNEQDLRNMMFSASRYNSGPWAIRYPRGKATGMDIDKRVEQIEIGKGVCLRNGDEIAVLSFGHLGKFVIEAAEILSAEGISIGHYDMRFAKPLDETLLNEICLQYKAVITIEDGTVLGGFGSAVAEYFSRQNNHPILNILGAPDTVAGQGSQNEQYREAGINTNAIIEAVLSLKKLITAGEIGTK